MYGTFTYYPSIIFQSPQLIGMFLFPVPWLVETEVVLNEMCWSDRAQTRKVTCGKSKPETSRYKTSVNKNAVRLCPAAT